MFLGQGEFLGIPMAAWCMIIVAIIAHIFLEETVTGRRIFTLGVLDVAIGQSFYNIGYESVSNLYKLIKGEDLGLPDDPAFGCPFINTGVQIATIDDYKEVMGLE